MKLHNLLENYHYELLNGNIETEIDNIEYDSRKVRAGTAFLCIRGLKTDGHNYIKDAVLSGASALIVETLATLFDTGNTVNTANTENTVRTDGIEDILPKDIAVIKVKNTRDALAYISSKFYKEPSKSVTLIGITGTRGKTAVAEILSGMFRRDGIKAGVIGSKGCVLDGENIGVVKNTVTTPEALEFNKALYEMNSKGTKYVIAEVTSHALELGRVDYCSFEIGIFTNIYSEHLDFHRTMENYENAKLKLFNKCQYAILNADEPLSRRISSMLPRDKVVTYGINSREADVTLTDISPEIIAESDNKFIYNYLAAYTAYKYIN